MGSGISVDREHPHGLQHQYVPRTPTWATVVAHPIRHQPCPLWKYRPQVSIVSGRSTDHGVLWRNNLVSEPFLVSNILSLLRARAIVGLGSLFWGWVCSSSMLLHTTLPTLLGNVFFYLLQRSLTPVTAAKSPVLPISTSNAPLSVPPSSTPLHHILVCNSGTGSCSMSDSNFSPNSFICKCSLQWVLGLIQGFWYLTHHQ